VGYSSPSQQGIMRDLNLSISEVYIVLLWSFFRQKKGRCSAFALREKKQKSRFIDSQPELTENKVH
jgi:hypothetical protein